MVAAPPLPPTRQAQRPGVFQVFPSWRMACVLLTGFSSGLPNALVTTTLQAWLKNAGVDIASIGVFALVALPYSWKFLWSPLMDRFVPPFFGRRRGWMLATQIGLALGIGAMAVTGVSDPWLLGLVALMVAFVSASQDIAVDAYRTEILAPAELGTGAGLYITGYRIGLISSGALALMLTAYLPWPWVYALMAAAMLVGIVTTLYAPEPSVAARAPQTLVDAVVLPFAEFLRRRGAFEMLAFIFIYKLDWFMVKGMMTPFLLSAGFTAADVGLANVPGLIATIVGATVGGAVVTAIGIRRSLWAFGLLQGLAGSSFAILAWMIFAVMTGGTEPLSVLTTVPEADKPYAMMFTAVCVENLCSGMATAAFVGFIMGLCDKRFTATQFALLTSLMALGGLAVQTPSGILAQAVGWPWYFVIGTVIMVPGLLLLTRFKAWQDGTPNREA